MSDEEVGGGASRTTDPAGGTSSATDVSLREYVNAQLNALDRHTTAELHALRRENEAANKAAERAIEVAAHEANERLQAHNGLIAQMQALSNTFATRETVESATKSQRDAADAYRETAERRFGRLERFQAMIVAGLVVVSTIGVANLVKIWTG